MEDKTLNTVSLEDFKSTVKGYLDKLTALRLDGTEKIKNLKYQNKSIKLKKNIEKEVKEKTIAENNNLIETAKTVAEKNKPEIDEIIKEAVSYINENFKGIYIDAKEKFKNDKVKVLEEFKQKTEALKSKNEENLSKVLSEGLEKKEQAKEIKVVKHEYKLKLDELKSVKEEKIQKLKDELHNIFLLKDKCLTSIRDGKKTILEKLQVKLENYIYKFDLKTFLTKNGLYIIILLFMIVCIIIKPSLISMSSNWLILKNFSTKVFFALGVAGLILLAGTDLSIGRLVTVSTMFTCMILNPNTPVEFFGISFNGIYSSLGFVGSVIIAFLLSIILCVAFSALAGFFTAKFKIHPFISTLGTSLVAWGLIGFSTNNIKTGTISDEALKIGNTTLGPVPIVLIYAIIAILVVWFIWNKTRFGKNLYAVGGNPEAAAVSGISVFKTTILAFIIAGVLYGLGGFFQATVTGSSSSGFGQGWELEAIAACVIGGISFTGGIGKISGAVFGCLLFEILKYYLRGVFGGSADIANIFIGAILLIAVTFDSIKYLKKK